MHRPRVLIVGLVTTAAIMAPGSGQANLPRYGLHCAGSGTTHIVPIGGNEYQWTLDFPNFGCESPLLLQTYSGSLGGSGTSSGLGLCSPRHAVRNLDIFATFYVEAPYDPAGGGPPLPNDFGWSGHLRANTTTFPVVTAFETGVLITRLAGACPPSGSDASSINIVV